MGRRSGAERRALRRLEREVFASPAVPPGRVTAFGVALRRRLLGAHRATAPPALQVLEALLAPMDGRVLATLVALGVPDLLDGPVVPADLAARTGTDPERLDRVLRYAAGRGLLAVDRKGRVRPTAVTESLRTDAPAPWHAWVRFATSDWYDAAWAGLTDGLEAGSSPPFDRAHGTDFFTHLTVDHPDRGAVFDEAMAAGATLQAIGLARVLEWERVASVCDVGGGTGAALDVVQRYHPHLDVTLFDLPEVVARSRWPARSPSHGARQVVAGSFFDEVPEGHDRYLLLAIVHDWDDERAVAVLSTVRAAMGPDAEAVVVENVLADRPRDDFATASDLLMFVLASGRERTLGQYERLFAGAGLRIDRRHLLPTGATAFVLRR